MAAQAAENGIIWTVIDYAATSEETHRSLLAAQIDLKFCGVNAACQTRVSVGSQSFVTTVGDGLDPTWEQTFEFDVEDEKTCKCTAVGGGGGRRT